MGKIENLNQRYWARLNDEIKNYSNFNPHKPKNNEYKLGLGKRCAKISLKVNSTHDIQECRVVIVNNTELFDILEKSKSEIEDRLGFELEWDRMSGNKSTITLRREFDIRNEYDWDEAIVWHVAMAFKFHDVFSPKMMLVN